jgi:DNA-binding GntR family transcriptional regulator
MTSSTHERAMRVKYVANNRAFQIKEALLRDIALGRLRHEQRLPAERELAQRFRASRNTVRQALEELEREGVVTKRGMSGTFVSSDSATGTEGPTRASSRVMEQLSASPWTTAIRRETDDGTSDEREFPTGRIGPGAQGQQRQELPHSNDSGFGGVKVISTEPLSLISAPPHVAQGLGVPLHALVLRRYQILQKITDNTNSIAETYYPGEPFIDLMREGLDDAGIDHWFDVHARPAIGESKVDLEIRRPTALEQHHLHLSHLAYLLVVRHRTFDREGHGLELMYAVGQMKPSQMTEWLQTYNIAHLTPSQVEELLDAYRSSRPSEPPIPFG